MTVAQPNLLVAVPFGETGQHEHYMTHCLLKWQRVFDAAGWPFEVINVPGHWPTASVRNSICNAFLEFDSAFGNLLMIDSDAVPEHQDMAHIQEWMERADVDVAGGWTLIYNGKEDTLLPCVMGGEQAGHWPVDHDLVSARPGLYENTGGAIGSHAIMIKRRVVKTFAAKGIIPFEDVYHRDRSTNKLGWGTRRLGHDIAFFRRCADLGFRTWVDTRVWWGHVKRMDLRAIWNRSREYAFQMNAMEPLVAELLAGDPYSTGETARVEARVYMRGAIEQARGGRVFEVLRQTTPRMDRLRKYDCIVVMDNQEPERAKWIEEFVAGREVVTCEELPLADGGTFAVVRVKA